MSNVEPSEYANVLRQVSLWPTESRVGLLHDVIQTLKVPTSLTARKESSVEQLIGMGSGSGAPPDDTQVKRWIDEYRMGKHG